MNRLSGPDADYAPADEGAIVAAVAEAHASGQTLLIRGQDSKAGMLRRVSAARAISTRNHAGITLYKPKELILAARAGTPLADIETALATHGQYLIAEPPALSFLSGGSDAADASSSSTAGCQTLGGIVAANLSGPRRVAWGAMRDHVLGVRGVNGTGEVIRSGGRVLKNVTGLDLCKLLTGSHGTLGILTEITLKVLPAPEAAGTLVLPGLDAAAGVAALSAALGSPFGVSGAAWLPREAAARIPALSAFDRAVALIRIEESATSVAYRSGKLRADLARFGRAELLDDTISRSVWRAVGNADPLIVEEGDAVWRVSVRPSAGPGVLRAVAEAAPVRGFLDWGGGLVWLAGPGAPETHRAVERAARAASGAWMLMRGPDALRASADVIPPEPDALARITARVKQALDPASILNPGRLYAAL